MLAFVAHVSFATIVVDGPMLVHAPVLVAGDDRLLFHVSRGNRAVPNLEGARAIASVLGTDYYVSPDWYGAPGQVPTWNYLAVEAEGPLRRLDDGEMGRFMDDLSPHMKAASCPSRPGRDPRWRLAVSRP
jgi:transcriptional regulator